MHPYLYIVVSERDPSKCWPGYDVDVSNGVVVSFEVPRLLQRFAAVSGGVDQAKAEVSEHHEVRETGRFQRRVQSAVVAQRLAEIKSKTNKSHVTSVSF